MTPHRRQVRQSPLSRDAAPRTPHQGLVDRDPRRSSTMCAAFVAVPLYVVIVTSFKTMDADHARARSSRCRRTWTLEPGGRPGTRCARALPATASRSGSSTRCRSCSRASCCRSRSRRSPATRWRSGTCAGRARFLFVLFICAFVPFQIIMIPLIVLVASMGIYGTIWAIALVHAVLAMPLLTLIFRNFYKDIPHEIINAAMMDSGSFWRIFVEIILPMSGNIMIVVLILMITTVWNDYLVGLTFGGPRHPADDGDPRQLGHHLARRGHLQRQHGGGAADRHPAARRLFRARASSSSRASPPARSRGRRCRAISFENIVKRYGAAHRARGPQPRGRGRRVPGAARAVRLRQDHAPQPARRAAGGHRRRAS